MISARGLVREFGAFRAVDGFSFEVEPGEIYGLLGPNGAGKTTTTRILSCLLRPTAGTAYVAGHSILSDAHRIREKIGILTEVPGLYVRLTPQEYLEFFAEVHGLRGQARNARVEEVLRLVDMWDRRRVVMRAFSKGMQQRVAIARTLLHEPVVLFFDEPTAALDPEAARNVRDHLLHLTQGRKRSVLLCTHNLPEAEGLCRRLSIVQSGRQVAEGTPTQLKAGVERGVRLAVTTTSPALLAAIERVEGALDVRSVEGGVAYRTSLPAKTNPEVVRAAVSQGADVVALREDEVSLEEVYLSLVRGAAARRNGTAEAAVREPAVAGVPA
ncbi:MAG: ABC transporter ATP-binding protein [Chloroflexi bacterium]|nr:ABC transporter ATP-binding protein [Chloroflexota bacterium]